MLEKEAQLALSIGNAQLFDTVFNRLDDENWRLLLLQPVVDHIHGFAPWRMPRCRNGCYKA